MTIYDIPVTTLDGTPTTLAPYRGQVLMIVNVASKCGFTGQYAGLESLYREYKDRGFAVLGFPCDQFGHQEPGDEAEIKEFCSTKFDVTFPMFSKVKVNGPDAHPLYVYLKDAATGLLGTKAIKWNFTKFLVGRDGTVIGRYGSLTTPKRLGRAVATLIDGIPQPPPERT